MRPLTPDERRIIVFTEVYARRNYAGPPWATVRRALELDRRHLSFVLVGLKRRGLVAFDESPGSLRATSRGLAAAVGRRTAA